MNDSRNLGVPLKYMGEWIKDPFTIKLPFTPDSYEVEIVTNMPNVIHNYELLTMLIDGISFKCRLIAQNKLRILGSNKAYTSIDSYEHLYVLRNIESDSPEELIPRSELDKNMRYMKQLCDAKLYNYDIRYNIKRYIGEKQPSEVESPSFGDTVYLGNDHYETYSKVMLACSIEKVSHDEIWIYSIDNEDISYISEVFLNNTKYTLHLNKRISDTIYSFTFDEKILPNINDYVYVSKWCKVNLPTKLIKMLIA